MGTSNVEVLLWTSLLAKQNSMCACVRLYNYIYNYILMCRYCMAFSITSNSLQTFSNNQPASHFSITNWDNLSYPCFEFMLWIHAALPSWTLWLTRILQKHANRQHDQCENNYVEWHTTNYHNHAAWMSYNFERHLI